MQKKLLLIILALGGCLLFGAERASAWQKDPDTVDPGAATAVIAGLLAPDPTLGNTDTTVAGVGIDPVGPGSLTSPAPDPADASPGHTYFVDNTPTDGDCPPA